MAQPPAGARRPRLLETSDLPLDMIAARVGFAGATLLRHHFAVVVGIAPSTYRQRFAATLL